MLKKILAVLVSFYAAASFAAVDINKATAAELDSVKGIGPALSGKIVDARKKGDFKSWADFIERVQGVGEGNAAKLSAAGLTVGGAEFKPAKADAQPAAKKEEMKKDAAKAEPAKKEEMKKDMAKAEPAKKEEMKKDMAKAEPAKKEEMKKDMAKAEPAKKEEMKKDAAKAEPAKK